MAKRMVMGALAGATLLAGCGGLPDLRPRPHFPAAVAAPATPGAGPAPSASLAEQQCLAAGASAGFDVQGVVGTRELTGADGMPVSRDVMLRVRRGSQTLDLRCSYAYDTGLARIMTL